MNSPQVVTIPQILVRQRPQTVYAQPVKVAFSGARALVPREMALEPLVGGHVHTPAPASLEPLVGGHVHPPAPAPATPTFDSQYCSLEEARAQVSRMEALISSLRKQLSHLKVEHHRLQSPEPNDSESTSTGLSSLPPNSPDGSASTSSSTDNLILRRTKDAAANTVGLELEIDADHETAAPVVTLEEASKRMRRLGRRAQRLFGQVSHLRRVNHRLRRMRRPVAKRREGRLSAVRLKKGAPAATCSP